MEIKKLKNEKYLLSFLSAIQGINLIFEAFGSRVQITQHTSGNWVPLLCLHLNTKGKSVLGELSNFLAATGS